MALEPTVAGPERERYWEEKTPEEKIEAIGIAIEWMADKVNQLESDVAQFKCHSHGHDGAVLIPMIGHVATEIAWWRKHILGRKPK